MGRAYEIGIGPRRYFGRLYDVPPKIRSPMKTVIALIAALLAGPLVVAQGTLSMSSVFAVHDRDTLRGSDAQIQLAEGGTPASAYLMTGEKVVALLSARMVATEGQPVTLAMDLAVKADRQKQSKHIELPIGTDGSLATTITEQFHLGANGQERPVTLSFIIDLE